MPAARETTAPRRGPRRVLAGLVTAVAVLLTTACSSIGSTPDPAGPSNAHCDAQLVQPFGCHDVLLLPGRYRAWFDTTRGARLVIEAPRGRLLVPVVVSRGRGTTAALALDGPTKEQCDGDQACVADVTLRTFFARVVRLQTTDSGFRLYVRRNEIGAVRQDTMTDYFPTQAMTSRGFTILTAAQGNGNQADLGGDLGFNAFGCATVNGAVVILPPGSEVDARGAITVDGERYAVGQTVRLGGSFIEAPPVDQRCGITAAYWWAG